MVRSHGLVVKREDSQLSGCGFKSWRCKLDSCQRSITIEKLMKNTGSKKGHKNYKKKMRKYMLIIFFMYSRRRLM
jgi:hypothetical protein